MAPRKRKPVRKGMSLAVQAANQGDYVWHPDEKVHSWTC